MATLTRIHSVVLQHDAVYTGESGHEFVAPGELFLSLPPQDRMPYHGLLFAFDAATLAQTAVFNPTPTGSEAGIWMSGASPTADSDGNIYVSTGNGTVSTNNYGESIVKQIGRAHV